MGQNPGKAAGGLGEGTGEAEPLPPASAAHGYNISQRCDKFSIAQVQVLCIQVQVYEYKYSDLILKHLIMLSTKSQKITKAEEICIDI